MKLMYKVFSSVGLAAVGIGLIVWSGWQFLQKHQITHEPVSHTMFTDTVTTSTEKPNETPVQDTDVPKVPGDQPLKIELPSINASGYIQKVGKDKQNAVAVPSNIFVAGWFTDSARPGEPGVSLIDGHVQGYYNPGIFKKLPAIKQGDPIQIIYGDYSTRKFEVVAVEEYSVDDAANHMLAQKNGVEKQLNLITCSGKFDKATQSYQSRTIVFAKSV